MPGGKFEKGASSVYLLSFSLSLSYSVPSGTPVYVYCIFMYFYSKHTRPEISFLPTVQRAALYLCPRFKRYSTWMRLFADSASPLVTGHDCSRRVVQCDRARKRKGVRWSPSLTAARPRRPRRNQGEKKSTNA